MQRIDIADAHSGLTVTARTREKQWDEKRSSAQGGDEMTRTSIAGVAKVRRVTQPALLAAAALLAGCVNVGQTLSPGSQYGTIKVQGPAWASGDALSGRLHEEIQRACPGGAIVRNEEIVPWHGGRASNPKQAVADVECQSAVARQSAESRPPSGSQGTYLPDGEYCLANCSQASAPPSVETTDINSAPLTANGRSEIPLHREGGGFTVPVSVNGAITLAFIIDSGATDVSIPADVVLTLMRTGTIGRGDFLGNRTYVLADGSTAPSPTFRIRSLRVGDREVRNVTGSIAPVKGGLLLGQSFLHQFGSWSIDNRRGVLVLGD
jgi:hypothetical protein